jgi:hypothetical protein
LIKISTYYVLHASEYNFTAIDELVWHNSISKYHTIWTHPKEEGKKFLDANHINYILDSEKDIKDLLPEEESCIWGYFNIIDPIERDFSELFDLIKFKWIYAPLQEWNNWYGFLQQIWNPLYELGDDYGGNPLEVGIINGMFRVCERLIDDSQIQFIQASNLEDYLKQPLIKYLSNNKGRYLYMTN